MENLAGNGSLNGFWSGRRVFLTGHTGFKGGWLALWLAHLGANVRGYALDPSTDPNLFTVGSVGKAIEDLRGDIRDGERLDNSMREFRPEVVFHLAAQPLVRHSYEDPIGTFETNVMFVPWFQLRRTNAMRTRNGCGPIASVIRSAAMTRTPVRKRVPRLSPLPTDSRIFLSTSYLNMAWLLRRHVRAM
jgi:hypothetical protein